MRRRKSLHSSLKLYLSKLKKVPSGLHLPNRPSGSTSRLLSACRYPKTPSLDLRLAGNNSGHTSGYVTNQAATLSDVDRFLYENFHSLYIAGDSRRRSPPSTSPELRPPEGRFLVSPGTSNSLLDETARPSAASSSSGSSSSETGRSSGEVAGAGAGEDAGVPVTTMSRDPYVDFMRSMKEMVDARHVAPCEPLDWEFMEELLFCYLELNDRTVHGHILRAFSDLTVSFGRRGSAEERGLLKGSVVVSVRRNRSNSESQRGRRLSEVSVARQVTLSSVPVSRHRRRCLTPMTIRGRVH